MKDNKKKTKIAIFGLFGSYTHQAAEQIFKNQKNKVSFLEKIFLSDLFSFVEKGNLAVFPIENSSGGAVSTVLDLFPKYNFEIIGEYFLEINHTLLGNKKTKIKDIREVYSHPQALAQTSNFLDQQKIKPISFSNTSTAAEHLKKNNFLDKAAIGSELLAQLYDLKILKRNFQNSKNNITRFLIIKKKKAKFNFNKQKNKKYKTSILFETRHIPGVLYKCLGGFATNGVNLTKIESRPSQEKKNFEPFFFVEFEGHQNDENVQLALEELNFYTQNIKFLGSYQKI